MGKYSSIRNKNSESQLIILCSQTNLSSQLVERISEILNHKLDWDFIKNVASRNGLLPLVSWNLLNSFAESLSTENKHEISQYLQNHTQNNLHSTLKLIEIVRTLKKEGIPILPFKGATLAKRAYGNLALRQYVDMDVLVKPKDFDKTNEILLNNGYKPIGNSNNLKRNSLFINRKKDIGLFSPDGSVPIELHWKLSGSHFALPFEIDELWNRLETIEMGGIELKALPFYDLFVYLCLHGSRHKWDKFAWICDLNELINSEETNENKIKWNAVRQHAQKYGCEKVVELGLFLVQYFYGLEVEYPGIEEIKNDKTFLKIAKQIQKKNFSADVSSSAVGEWYLYHLTLKERKSDRLRLHIYYILWYLKLTFRPNSLDEQVFHLPSIFYPLYYILRPIRLLFTYLGFSSKKKPILPNLNP